MTGGIIKGGKKPVFKDGCEHSAEEFLGTVVIPPGDVSPTVYDVYCYPEDGEDCLCLRYGDDPDQCLTPPPISVMRNLATSRNRGYYKLALRLYEEAKNESA